jgi:hypothetical protein
MRTRYSAFVATDADDTSREAREPDAEAGPRSPAQPFGAIAEGTPRWLAWIVLIALLAAGVASVWLVLTLPPYVPEPPDTADAPLAEPHTP